MATNPCVGSQVGSTITFTNPTGVATTPSTVKVLFGTTAGSVVDTFIFGTGTAVKRTGFATYRVIATTTGVSAGAYVFQWQGTGNGLRAIVVSPVITLVNPTLPG